MLKLNEQVKASEIDKYIKDLYHKQYKVFTQTLFHLRAFYFMIDCQLKEKKIYDI